MLSNSHPLTATHYKSEALCRKEKLRHIIGHKFIISPFSMCWLYWEFFMFINYLLRFIFISIWASSDFEEVDIAVFGFVTALDVTVYMDIIKNFFTGYYDAENNLTVLKPRLIALRYLKFYFWVDFLSVVSVFAYPIVILSGLSETIRMLGQVARCLKLIMILRGPRWSFSMELFRQYMNLSSYLFKATKSFLTYIMVMCWLYTVMITLENIIHQYVYHKNVNPYKIRRYFSVTLVLLLVSYGADPITEVIDAVIATFFICVGFCMQMYLYGKPCFINNTLEKN
nr:unnamed protein product [Callosobruchus analis]